ncbi:MAG: protein kinase domain-containing protein [Thermodesulfobacteriota bacterium]
MAPSPLNCWEYKRCRREPGGDLAATAGVCPAAADGSFDGLNRGKNAGRICWAVSGTVCDQRTDGDFRQKREACGNCTFFQRVQAEEAARNLVTKFMRFVPLNGNGPPAVQMDIIRVNQGQRFIEQGAKADCAFLIRRGSCILVIEKNKEWIPVSHRSEGDFVDMMALLTGEPHGVTAEAESDMELMIVTRDHLGMLAKEDPDLMTHLTEIVAERFDSGRPMAQRAIGNHIATEIIGRGGYSIVYKGQNTVTRAPVVIKMLRHHLAMEPEFLTAFRREAEIIAGLNHPHIVQVYDIEERFQTVFIVMEFLAGESLKQTCSRPGGLSYVEVEEILIQIAEGLRYAHETGIIHRDINPANIHILPGNVVKILDFGLACPIGTENTDTLGTLQYSAPEQIDGDIADERTDLYALGLTAYEMVTGRPPFAEMEITEQVKRRLREEIPDPALVRPDIPEHLRAAILKACRREPRERYAFAGDLLAALRTGNRKQMQRSEKKTWNRRTTAGKPSRMDVCRKTARAHGESLQGKGRRRNDDCHIIRPLPGDSVLLAVADGMGGENGGFLAAGMVCRRLREAPLLPPDINGSLLGALLTKADKEIARFARANPEYQDMGTTATVVVAATGTAFWAHAGDSRLCLFRNGQLIQITRDQNMAQFLVEEGRIASREAGRHPAAHLLEQCLGQGDCRPDGGEFKTAAGDYLLLSTDGLHDTLSERQIRSILLSTAAWQDIPAALTRRARAAGATDDISAVILRI